MVHCRVRAVPLDSTSPYGYPAPATLPSFTSASDGVAGASRRARVIDFDSVVCSRRGRAAAEHCQKIPEVLPIYPS